MQNACMNTQGNAAERSRGYLLTLKEVAERLACSRRYVDELVKERRLRAVRISPKVIRVSEFDLLAFCCALPVYASGAA